MTYQDTVLASAPSQYWKLDETGSVVTARNEVSLVEGHYIAAPTLNVAGPLKLETNSAVSFNAPDAQYAGIDGSSIITNATYSIEFWVKGAAQSGAVIYSESADTGSALFSIGSGTSNTAKLKVVRVDNGGVSRLSVESTTTVFDGNWHHVVFADNAGAYTIYVDKVVSNSGSYTQGTLTPNRSTLAAQMVYDTVNLLDAPINFLTGSVDEVALYPAVLSATAVAEHYRAAFTLFIVADTLLKLPNVVHSLTADAKLKKRLSLTADALIVDPRGSFRGSMSTAERDALVALQPQDTIINVEIGQQQYWTGPPNNEWLSGGTLASPGSGQDNNIVAPTTESWRAELGDSTYPIRYWNGSIARFTVDDTGNVVVVGSVTAGSFIGGSIDIPDLTTAASFHADTTGRHWAGANASNYATAPFRVSAAGALVATSATISGAITGASIDVPSSGATGFHVDGSGNVGTGGTTATDVNSPFLVTSAGALSARTAIIYPKDASSKALTLRDDKGTSASLLELIANTTVIASFDAANGTFRFNGGFLPAGVVAGTMTAQQNDWIIGGDKFRVRITLTGNQDLTGIVAISNGVLILENGDDTDILTLKHESASSSAANRFYLPNNTDLRLRPREATVLYYNGTDSRWHTATGPSSVDLSSADASGTLAAARFPALTGDVTTSAGSLATTLAAGNAGNLNSGTLLAARMPAHTGDVTSSAGSVALTLAAGSASVLNSGTLAAARMPALTGDVTTSAGAVATTIANDAVTFAKMANIATNSLIGRDTAATGDPETILLDNTLEFDGSLNLRRAALTGDVTAPAGSNTTTLAAGSAANLNSGTLAAARMPALTGDVTTSAGAVATTIANDSVSYAKMQNVSATSRILGRISASAGDTEELTAANVKTILALQASDLSDNSNLAKLNAANTFTLTPQTLTIASAANKGLVINLAASQTGRAIEVVDSDGVAAFQMAGSGADILMAQYATNAQISARRAEGTNLLPTAAAADSLVLGLGARPYNGSAFTSSDKAQIGLYAAELFSTTAQGTYIAFLTTKKTTTTRTEVGRFTDDGAFQLAEVATPANPASGAGRFYYGTDSLPHTITDAGTNYELSRFYTLGTAAGDTIYYSGSGTPARLAANATATKMYKQSVSGGNPSWAQVDYADLSGSLPAHGDSSHSDVTRSAQWYSVENFTLDSGTGATLGAVPTGVAAVALADAALQGFYFDFVTPSDWASGAINAYIYWVPGSTDATSHTVRWRFNVIELVAGTDVTAAATATNWTGSSAARTANLMVVETSQAVITPSAANSIIKFNIRRVGADAADTYVGVVNVIGVRLDYTATN